jgi:hypothetical protein
MLIPELSDAIQRGKELAGRDGVLCIAGAVCLAGEVMQIMGKEIP